MRRAAAFLMLLLCLYWTRAQGESGGVTGNDITQTEVQSEILGVKATGDQTIITPDIWAELKELRDIANQQSVELRKLEQQNTAIQARLTASESKIADRPKVAFSLGLTDAGQVGPFNTDITLKFSKVFTNFGQAYSPTTGHFTAPVRGAYYFSFTTVDNRIYVGSVVYLYHNDKRVLWNHDYNDEYGHTNLSNSMVLQLEKGDVVYMVLPASYSVYDDRDDRSTFNGFLLFPL
ncbi:adiponectin-like isoform X2 [Scomber scombrus]|uniref:adiponectin-like isoform X2 n=1 Tax=Scomber scombrus TaxID=13677 RepID=UPI002DD92836|nr:adiponectin-like isoform X2 [Scomber scombrus]